MLRNNVGAIHRFLSATFETVLQLNVALVTLPVAYMQTFGGTERKRDSKQFIEKCILPLQYTLSDWVNNLVISSWGPSDSDLSTWTTEFKDSDFNHGLMTRTWTRAQGTWDLIRTLGLVT